MTPRPIHRWKTFWLGILVLTFLGWAWVRSQSHRDGIRYNSGPTGTSYDIQISSGRIWLGRTTGLIPRAPETEFISDENPDPGWFAPAFFHTARTNRTDSGNITILDTALAHWFLILLFLIPWAALLAWRWQRMKRLTDPKAQPSP